MTEGQFSQLADIAKVDLNQSAEQLLALGIDEMNRAETSVLRAGAYFLKLKELTGRQGLRNQIRLNGDIAEFAGDQLRVLLVQRLKGDVLGDAAGEALQVSQPLQHAGFADQHHRHGGQVVQIAQGLDQPRLPGDVVHLVDEHRLPARPFLGLSTTDRSTISNIVAGYLAGR